MRSSLFLLLTLLLRTAIVAAQDPAPPPAEGAVGGLVHDSLAGRPLPGAVVQLVGTGARRELVRSVTTEGDGRFAFADIPPGRYMLGFLHPVLDSLRIESRLLAVDVTGRDTVRVVLAVPSARGLRAIACGGYAGPEEPPAAAMGIVRNAADQAPVAGAIVEAAWLEYDVGHRVVTRRHAGATDTTGADGRFTLCDVPRGGSLALRAHRGDTTAVLELPVPVTGLLRRDLHLGESRAQGTISGVVQATSKQPIADAQVSIEGGPTTRSAADGRWTLAGAPMGTRVLEVRRVGDYPTRLPVDVLAGAPALEVTLPEFQAVLDTVRVTASRLRLETTGFETRRRSMGAGRFITTADVLRQPVLATSDLFVRIPGMRVDRAPMGETRITMRGIFGRCRPSIFINGMYMSALTAEDLDAFVHPDEIAGVEVYSGTFVPAEFQQAFGGCGSIVVWTKVGESPVRGWSAKRRALWGAGAVALGAAIGVIFANH